ncbi:MAG: AMP-binding protein, partial [Desulfamplus sp.]|nr:AMP-binding protein [Desulfamplus sp.]
SSGDGKNSWEEPKKKTPGPDSRNPGVKKKPDRVRESLKGEQNIAEAGILNEPELSLPLTRAQQQLWFLSRLNENAVPAYIETVALGLAGPLDQKALFLAAEDLVQRHRALRTVISKDGSHQVILPHMPANMEMTRAGDVQLSKTKKTARDPHSVPHNTVQAWLRKNSTETFDLIQGPLFSFKLLEIDPENHLLAMNFHHIVMDGLSVNILLGDMMRFYAGRITGQDFDPDPAPDLRAYQSWLGEYLESPESQGDREYWQKLFPRTIPMLDFPGDRPRPSLFSFRGARHHLQADSEVLQKCLALGRSRRMTPFMTLISLYTLWIHKLTGKDEVVIGFPVAGRFFPGSEELVGYCTHLVPFVSHYRASDTLGDYLDSSRKNIISAYRHQKYPFSHLIRNLQFEQDLSRGSVIASEFNLDKVMDMPALEGLTLSMVDIPLSYVKYDLNLEIMEVSGQYQFKFVYATDIFEPETITRMADHFMTLLTAVSREPRDTLGKISLLNENERHTLLMDWNQTERDFPLDQPFHRLFEAQVDKTPDRVAASFTEAWEDGSGPTDGSTTTIQDMKDQKMTYRELNAQANRLARQLISKGADTSLVPILADRSCHFLVAMLGIFKAGCAYLPLDPEHPADRIAAILGQVSRAYPGGDLLILAEKKFSSLLEKALNQLPEGSSQETIWFEDAICHAPLQKEDHENLAHPLLGNKEGDKEHTLSATQNAPSKDSGNPPSESLAYVIFTSGSTGLPKGAMVQQKGMVNHIFAKIQDLGITENDVVAQNASQCFDISVWQFLSPLVTGGRVEIMDNDTAQDPARLITVAARGKVTILELVPSLMRVLIEQMDVTGGKGGGNLPQLTSLRWLVPTGEALPPLLCTQWFRHYPKIPILNAYGPTECSDDVAHYALHGPPQPHVSNIPIGRPVANMRLYILDEE